MIDLEAQLRVLAEDLPVERGEPVVRAVSNRRRRHRRRRLAAIGSVGLVVVALVAGVVGAWPNGTVDDDGVQVTTGPTVPDRAPGWHELDAGPMTGRTPAVTVWADDQLIVFAQDDLVDGAEWADVSQGFSYSPDDGAWRRLPEGPDVDLFPTAAVWTGTEVILTGRTPSGARSGVAYSPATERWRRLEVSAPPEGFTGASYYSDRAWRDTKVVWTGSEVLFPLAATSYGVDTGRWRSVATPPGEQLVNAEVAWTGEEVIVVGRDAPYSQFAGPVVGYAFDPAARTWRVLPPSGLSSQSIGIAWNGAEIVAVNYDMTAKAYDPEADTWRDLPPLPLRFSECSPRVLAVGATTLVEMCTGLALGERDLGFWWSVPGEATLVAAGDRAFGFGEPRDEAAAEPSDRPFYEFVPPVDEGGEITPPRELVVGLDVLEVPEGADIAGHANDDQLGGLANQIRFQLDWEGERCIVSSTYAGTGAAALVDGYRDLDGARQITVSPRAGGPDRPALLLPEGARLPDDEQPHVVFELDDRGGSDVTEVSCASVGVTRDLARFLHRS